MPHTPEPSPSARRSRLRLHLTVGRFDNRLVVQGELDPATGPRLDRTLRWLEHGTRPLRLDLRGVGFVDCAGWRVVTDASQRRHRRGMPALQLIGVSPQVRRLTGLLARYDGPLRDTPQHHTTPHDISQAGPARPAMPV